MNRDRTRVGIAVAATAAIAVGAGLAARAAAEPGPPRVRRLVRAVRPDAPGWHEDQTLVVAGSERWFRFYVPPTLVRPPAVVILLHGGTQSMRKLFGPNSGGTQAWRDLADENGFLLLVPNGTNADTGDPSGDDQNWNDCRSDAAVAGTTADDVGFIAALVDWSDRAIGIDRTRVYATGASNGGGMTYRLAIERPDLIAAAAVFIMNLAADSECPAPSHPVPLFVSDSDTDPLVPFDGGGVAGGTRGTVISNAATLAAWLAANHAGPEPDETADLPDLDPTDGCTVSRAHYAAQPGGAEVEWLTVHGGGHSMPSIVYPVPQWILSLLGLGRQCHDLEGARVAWAFLSRHRLAAPPAAR